MIKKNDHQPIINKIIRLLNNGQRLLYFTKVKLLEFLYQLDHENDYLIQCLIQTIHTHREIVIHQQIFKIMANLIGVPSIKKEVEE
jgi:hypothetical protein